MADDRIYILKDDDGEIVDAATEDSGSSWRYTVERIARGLRPGYSLECHTRLMTPDEIESERKAAAEKLRERNLEDARVLLREAGELIDPVPENPNHGGAHPTESPDF